MKPHTVAFAAASLLLSAMLFVTPAAAQASRTWVSGIGLDSDPCSRTAPCKTFTGAFQKTLPGGEINCLDPGGYGGLNITNAITIDCSYTEGGALVAGTNGISVNAGSTDVIVLRGLDINGQGTGLSGIRFNSGRALHVIDVQIHGFRATSAGNGNGILFAPTFANSELFVQDSNIHENGAGPDGGGIVVKPVGSGSARVSIDNVNVSNNLLGIRADGTSNAGAQVAIVNSVISGNTNGGVASFTPAAGPAVKVVVEDSIITGNGTGINGNGANASLRIGSSLISHNATGVAIQNGATVTSFGDNDVIDNTAAGAALPAVPQS